MQYLWLTLRHKWFVFLAGLRTKTPLWLLLTHDISKLLPFTELRHYQRQFFGSADDPGAFVGCWLHHQNRNPHHWEYWIPRTGYNRCTPPYPDGEPIPMPAVYVREMVADWLGAGRAYAGRWPDITHWTWLKDNLSRMQLHPLTRERLDVVLHELGMKS